jgi:hypothetical protein
MRKTKLLTFVLCALLGFKATAQNTFSGYIIDAQTLEKLPSASIILPYDVKITTTNNYGFFAISTAKDTASVIIRCTGYYSLDTFITKSENSLVNIYLQPLNKNKDDEVIIRSSKKKLRIEEQTQMSKVSIPIDQIKALPRFLGEVDVLKALQLLPGVSQGAEGTSGLLVRGGAPDQNLMLLDGTPVYNASHLFGIFSVFNGDAIKSVELYKGGFPARFGGRLSSVVDIVLKDGNKKEFHGEANLGLLTSRLTLEGPIGKNKKTSYIVAGRRTYFDVLAQPFIKQSETGIDKFAAYFYDLNAKINHDISKKDKLYLSFFSGQDFLKINVLENNGNSTGKTKIKFGWGNIVSTARWNHVFNPRLFSNTLVNFTQYRFLTEVSNTNVQAGVTDGFAAKYFSGISDIGTRTDFDYRPASNHNIKFGAQILQHSFSPGATTVKVTSNNTPSLDTALNNIKQRSTEANIYIEDDWQATNNLKVNIGLHASVFKAKTKTYPSLQPRLGARYLLPKNWSIKASYTHMNQFIHLLTNNATTLPTDLWVPSTDKVKPQFSQQAAIGFAKSLRNNTVEFSAEAYYKTMDGIIEYKDGASFLSTRSENWDTKVEAGKGLAYGFEVLLQKKEGRTTGWVGYTLAWSTRQFDNINFGKKYFYKYDRRHDFEITVNHKLSKRWEVSGTWAFNTAAPFTLPVSQYNGANQVSPFTGSNAFGFGAIENFGGRNAFRLLNYHRLDWGFTYRKQKRRYEKMINISCYNAYNRNNPFFYQYDIDYNTNTASLSGYSILPILPNVSFGWKF